MKTFFDRYFRLPIGLYKKDGKHQKKGRQRLLSDRDNRKIMRCLHELKDTVGNFACTNIKKTIGIRESKSRNRTIWRSLRRLVIIMRKVQLPEYDLKSCLIFPLADEIFFHLDGTSWTFKSEPMESFHNDRKQN